MMAILSVGRAFIAGISVEIFGSARSSFAIVLASRMWRFFSLQFQIFRPAICHAGTERSTGDAQDFPASFCAARRKSESLPGRPS